MNIAELVLDLTGLCSAIVVPVLFWICWRKNRFDLKKNTISDCGSSRTSSSLFNFTLVLFGILEVLFSYAIARRFLSDRDWWLLIPPLIAGIFVLIDAVFDTKRFKGIHTFFGYATFITLIVWNFVFHYFLLNTNPVLGIVGILISVMLFVGMFVPFLMYGACAIPEIFFIVFVVIWNLFFTYAIFFM